jgi:hypothetical protein
MNRLFHILAVSLAAILFAGCTAADLPGEKETGQAPKNEQEVMEITEDGDYTGKEEVALYIHTFNKLPNNYITKEEAGELDWKPSEGNLWEVTEQRSIGGNRFENREGNLPEKDGRIYYEADINYEGGYRGPERIVYSNDGLIYYTPDHYDTFILLYGDEEHETGDY